MWVRGGARSKIQNFRPNSKKFSGQFIFVKNKYIGKWSNLLVMVYSITCAYYRLMVGSVNLERIDPIFPLGYPIGPISVFEK